MKRGLVVLDPSEIPDAEWEGRLRSVQDFIADERLDLLLVYGDVYRSDDIGYLTNLCIYWNEGVIAVPPEGEAMLLTKLSPRVHTWMRKTSTVSDIRSGKSFGELVAALAAGKAPGTIGMVDGALWPAEVLEDIRRSIPEWNLRLLGSVVRDRRAIPSRAETIILRTGAALLSRAVDDAVARTGASVTGRIAQLERDIRGAGFTDVQISTSLTGKGVLTLQATGQYRHSWPHAGRVSVTSADMPWVGTLEAALTTLIAAARAGTTITSLQQAARGHLQGLPGDAVWNVRAVNQADMSTGGEFRSAELEDAPLQAGEAVILSIEMLHSGGELTVVAETVLITANGAEQLTITRA